MKLLEVHRSPVRFLLFGLVGLVLVLTAVDVMWVHRVSSPPETNNDALTTRGANQQRADYLWGVPMILAGAGMFGYAFYSLVRRDPVLVVRDDGVDFLLGKPSDEPSFVPWEAIADVYTALDPDPDGGQGTAAVVFDFIDTEYLPAQPWDAEWDGSRLRVNAGSWEQRPEDVVVHARVALAASRRQQQGEGGDDG